MARHRWAGAVAALAAGLVAVQSAGVSLLTAQAAQCCCAHREAHCHCKVCEHARELASGKPSLKSCGEHAEDSATVPPMDPVVPTREPLSTMSPQSSPVDSHAAVPPLEPPFEVPTPPPLLAA